MKKCMAVLLLLAVLCLTGFVSASADGEGYALQLSNVETQLRADGEQLVINGTVNGPENVAEILIAGWMDNEPSASEALEYAQFMTEVWKEDFSSFPEQEHLTKPETPEAAVIELPGGVEFPSLEECKAFDGWDAVTIEEGACGFTVDPRKNLPYKVIVQYIGTQRPGAGLVVQVSGTDADPRGDKESPILYNAMQFHYWEGDTNPSMGWVTTSYDRVGNLFDNAWLSVYYRSDYQSVRDGHAMLGIHGEFIQVNYWYGWEITDEVRTALSADGLLEERLAWLNAWQPKPLTIQLTAPLSIRDLMVKAKVLRLPANLKEIESEAFIGVDVDRIIIPPTVETIADDAFDDDILLILPNDSLEDWARTHHPSYIIDHK